MSSESVCQAARRWVDVGSFHARLFGVVYVTCGDFHNGSEKGTASLHQVLCQSWVKCYGDPQNDSTRLRGPKLESYTGVSMAYPVQDLPHISWRRRTHREAHKLHKSWNSCTNSTAYPSGSKSDHSWHCWGGGSWLWDIPTGSDGRIWQAPCRSQIRAHDPDSWPEAAARQTSALNFVSSRPTMKVLVQGHHWWLELGLRLRPWEKATILPVEKPHVTKAKKEVRQVKSNLKSMTITFFDIKGIVHKEFVPTRQTVNSGFYCEVLRRLPGNVRRHRPQLLREQTRLLHHDNVPSHTAVLTQQFLVKIKIAVIPHPLYLHYLVPCDFFLFPKLKFFSWKDAGLIPLRRSRPNRRECLTLRQKRTYRKRSKNGDSGTSVYIREGTTSRVTATDRPYGEFYDFYSVSPENFGSTHVRKRNNTKHRKYKYTY